ncbi:hypothetical protein GE061_007420 [Apolygus lucorum]|uniref:Uncharacterized protein n=1 Tax=Apolygus lucorum TaxID=248454 RepID=A0A6A4J6P6_APOLU|nr:hypothetical protein GE061_007420 [Apolygus lucorum]
MTSSPANFVATAGVLFLVVCAVLGEEKRAWNIHGDAGVGNGVGTQTLGGYIADDRNKLSLDGLRSNGYQRGQVEYGRQILTDGTRSLTGHAGLSADNFGNQAKNFGLGYQDPKNSVTWDRSLQGPVRTDSFRGERTFWSTNDGRGTLGGYIQHDRNNFGMRNTHGGLSGTYRFP